MNWLLTIFLDCIIWIIDLNIFIELELAGDSLLKLKVALLNCLPGAGNP